MKLAKTWPKTWNLPWIIRRLRPDRLFARFVVVVLVAVLMLSPPRAENYGDNYQIALPLLAWSCAFATGSGGEFFVRYLMMFTVAHGSKRALVGTELNQRPHGGEHGFPSAHTSTAVLGASALVHECLRDSPVVAGFTLLAAGFTGASRIEAGAHDIWQVLAGALLGWACDRAFRRNKAVRRRLRRGAIWLFWRMPRALAQRSYRAFYDR